MTSEVFFSIYSMEIKGIFKESGVATRLLLLVIICLLLSLAGGLLTVALMGADLTELPALRTAQAIQSIAIFLLPPFALAFLLSLRPFEFLQLNKVPLISGSLLTILLMIVLIPGINLQGDLNGLIRLPAALSGLEQELQGLEARAEAMTVRLLSVDSFQGLLLNLALIAVLPALAEELFFRASLQRILHDKLGAHAAVWIAAIVFSTIHFQFYGFIPRVLLGALMGYLLVWSGNLWIPILAHFVNNAMAVLFYYFKAKGMATIDLEQIGGLSSFYWGLASLVVAVVVIAFIFRRSRRGAF